MKYPEVKMGFGFWWRRLEFCHSHEGWVLSPSNAAGVTWDIHLCRTTKKRNLYFEMMGEFSSLLSLSVMSKTSPCPRMGFPCSPLPCPDFSCHADSAGFCLHCFPLQIFFFLIMRSSRAQSPPTFWLLPQFGNNCKQESPWLLCIMVPIIVWGEYVAMKPIPGPWTPA